jgi:hypothetical protein
VVTAAAQAAATVEVPLVALVALAELPVLYWQ